RAVAAALARGPAVFGPAIGRIGPALRGHRVSGETCVRPRHLYAVHKARGGDVTGLRPGEAARLLILVDGPDTDCYVALGAVHSVLHPIPGRLRDHIAMPKDNLYRSLHTRVVSPDGDPIEVIIRSRAMHPLAEYGIVASVREAGDHAAGREVAGRRDLVWLSRLLAWQSAAPSDRFLDGLRADLAPGTVAAFTADGRMVTLPEGATALDFAYALDDDSGERSIGALVNGRLAPLSVEVRSGNVVEVLTGPGASPSPEWLDFAVTAHARVGISEWLARHHAERSADAGRRRLAEALAGRRVDLLAAEARGDALAVARDLGYAELEEMYAALEAGSLRLPDLLARLLPR
ncbi:TGS domain-containing protein, partial [Actinomadura harenae]